MNARYAVDDFNGPQEGVRRIALARDSHRFYCSDCIAAKNGQQPLTGPACPVAAAYDRAVADMRSLYETTLDGA